MNTISLSGKRWLAALAAGSLLMCWLAFATAGYQPSESFQVKQAAAATAAQAQAVLGNRLIGPEYTFITTTLGPLEAKRLSLQPDFAAVAVKLLLDAGIKAGDRVAVNFSGSFPALNIAVLAAVQAVGAQPVITSSVGSSTWGATDPDYTWLDMEKSLSEAGLWPWRSQGVSVGGAGDRGGGLPPEGLALARQAIERSGRPVIQATGLEDAIRQRLDIYRRDTGVLPKALINVGGSQVIFGSHGHKTPLQQGLNRGYRPERRSNDGLAAAFLNSSRPVIHVINISRLAAQYGIRADSPAGASRVYFVRKIPPAVKAAIFLWLVLTGAVLWQGNRKGWWQGGCRQ